MAHFLKTSAVYFVGMTLTKLVGFMLLPIYTRTLAPSEFGAFDFWTTLVSFLGPIAFFQVWDATYRFHFEKDADASSLATNGFVLMLLGLAIYALSMIPLLSRSGASHVLLLLFFGVSLSLQYFLGYFARAELNNALFVGSGVANTIANAGVSLTMLYGGRGITSLYMGLIVGNAVQCAILFVRMRPDRRIEWARLDRRLQSALLRFSLPLCLTSAAYWLLAGYSRLEAIYFLGEEANGYLAIAFRFAMVVTLMTTVLVYAWNELLYLTHAGDDASRIQQRGGRIGVQGGLSAAALTILAINLFFESFVGSDYSGARDVVPLIVVATVLNSIATLLASIFMAEGETSVILWSTLAAAAVNVLVGLAAVHAFGLLGVGLALILAFGVMVATRSMALTRRYAVRVVTPDSVVPTLFVVVAMFAYYREAPASTTVIAATLGIGAVALTFRRAFA